ncbi:MAG: DUF1801 domain-containing protein [Kofleriaceae bacterium]
MPKRSEVEKWLAAYNNPMKPVVMAAREVILAADSRIDECIKWQTPTFMFNGNLASFNPRSKKRASLMFHVGAMIPGSHPKLEGRGDTARFMTFPDVASVHAVKRDLKRIVKAWCDWQDATTAKKIAAKRAAPRKAVKKKAVAAKKTTAAKGAAKKVTAKTPAKRAAPKKPTRSRAKKA